MQNKLKAEIATMAIALVFGGKNVRAESFTFNQYIGKVYVKTANIDFSDNGVNLSVDIHIPTCANRYHIDGYVEVSYEKDGGNVSRRWTFSGSDEEDTDRKFSDYLPYRQNPGNALRVKTSSTCIWHG